VRALPALIIIVILSEAKDLLSPVPAKKQVLRFTQDDSVKGRNFFTLVT
jgi:hypothetical protein